MPNWVINQVEFKGKQERINELLERIKGDDVRGDGGEGVIDFNKIVPMPEALNIECGGSTDNGIELFLTAINKDAPWFERDWVTKLGVNLKELHEKLNFEKRFRSFNNCLTEDEIEKIRKYSDIDKLLETGFKACCNLMEYGATTWYEWCIKMWGTKWNASESYIESPTSISFNTAWGAAIPVLKKLAQMYPDVKIELKFADEDIGSNCGRVTFKGDSCDEEYFEYGEESVRFACDLWGFDPDEFLEEDESEDEE